MAGSIDNILLASTAALLAASSFNFVSASATPSPISATTAKTTASVSKATGTGTGGGGGGGGPSMDVGPAAAAAVSSAKEDVRRYEDSIAKNPYQVCLFHYILWKAEVLFE